MRTWNLQPASGFVKIGSFTGLRTTPKGASNSCFGLDMVNAMASVQLRGRHWVHDLRSHTVCMHKKALARVETFFAGSICSRGVQVKALGCRGCCRSCRLGKATGSFACCLTIQTANGRTDPISRRNLQVLLQSTVV